MIHHNDINKIQSYIFMRRQKEKEAMKGEMDRRIIYGSERFIQEMITAHNISEKIKQIGRQRGWRKNTNDCGEKTTIYFDPWRRLW